MADPFGGDPFGDLGAEFGSSGGAPRAARSWGDRAQRQPRGRRAEEGGAAAADRDGLSLEPADDATPRRSRRRSGDEEGGGGGGGSPGSPATPPRAKTPAREPGSAGSRSPRGKENEQPQSTRSPGQQRGASPRKGDSPRKGNSPRAGAAPGAATSGDQAALSSQHSRAGSSLIFEGHVAAETGSPVECIASFPGRYEAAWRRLVARNEARQRDTNAACVFYTDTHRFYGKHAMDEDTGKCYCHTIYGSEQPWGCKWFDTWANNVKQAAERHQTLVVCYFRGQVGQGKRKWRDLGLSFAERVQQRTDGKLQGLGVSQAAEVAWLERKGLTYEERDALRTVGEEQEEAGMLDAIEAQLESANGYATPKLFNAAHQATPAVSGLLEKAAGVADPNAVVRTISDPYMLAGLLLEWLRTRMEDTIPPEYCEECCATVDDGINSPELDSLEDAGAGADGAAQPPAGFASVLHADAAAEVTMDRLGAVVDGLATFTEVGRLRLVRIVLILQRVDQRHGRVTSQELAALFAPILFSQTWLDELEPERRALAATCGTEFVRLLIDRWVSDDGGRGLEEIALENVALRVRQLYASQRRLDTKQLACDDAKLQFELADREQRKQHKALTELLHRMQGFRGAILTSRVVTIRRLADEAVAAERKVDRLRAAYRRASIYSRLRKDEEPFVVQEADARRNALQQELNDTEAYVAMVYAQIDGESHKVVGDLASQSHQQAREQQLEADLQNLELEIREEMEGLHSRNAYYGEDLRRLRLNIAALQSIASDGGAAPGVAALERAGKSLQVLRRLEHADETLISLQEELQQGAPIQSSGSGLSIAVTAKAGQSSSARSVALCGWLMVRCKHCITGSVATWKRRWFEVESGILSCYTKPSSDGGNLKEQFALQPGIEVHAIARRLDAPNMRNKQPSEGDKLGQRWCFVAIFEGAAPLYLQALNSDQRTQWIDAITTSVAAHALDDTPVDIYNSVISEVVDELMPQFEDGDDTARIRAAATVLHDGLHKSTDVLRNKLDATSLNRAQLNQTLIVRYVVGGAIWAHLLLGFLEPSLFKVTSETEEEFPSVSTFTCTPARVIELCLCAIHLGECILRTCMHRGAWCTDGWLLVKSGVSIACVGISVGLLFTQACSADAHASNAASWLSLSHLLRPILLLEHSQALREVSAQFVMTLRALQESVWVILGLVLFWTIMGQIAFLDSQLLADSDCTKELKALAAYRFRSLHSGVSEMLYLTFGSSTFPDVMLPALVECSNTKFFVAVKADQTSLSGSFGRIAVQVLTILFFVSFLIIMLCGVLNTVLTIIVTSHRQFKAAKAVAYTELRKGSLLLAFKLCDVNDDGVVPKRDMESVYKWYCGLRGLEFDRAHFSALFARLDKDSGDNIQVDGFFALADIMDEKPRHSTVPAWITDGLVWNLQLPIELDGLEVTALKKRNPSRDPGMDITAVAASTQVQPATKFVLSWDAPHDLDLYCVSRFTHEPKQGKPLDKAMRGDFTGLVSYREKESRCGGVLAGDSESNQEVMTWDRPNPGSYEFEIRNDRGRSLQSQGLGPGAPFRCKIVFAYGGDFSIVESDGQKTQRTETEKFEISWEGNTLDFEGQVARYKFIWGGYRKVEHRVHAMKPRVQRAIQALAQIDPSRVSAVPVSELGITVGTEVDVCMIVGGAKGVLDGVVVKKQELPEWKRSNRSDDLELEVSTYISNESGETEQSDDADSVCVCLRRKNVRRLFLTFVYCAVHDLVHLASVVGIMFTAVSTQSGSCTPVDPDPTQSCRSNIGDIGSVITIVCSVALTIDMFAKILAFGFVGYWKTRLHRLDGIVAVCGIVALTGLLFSDTDNTSGWRRTWRLLLSTRLWSITRLCRHADQNFAIEKLDALLLLVWRMLRGLVPLGLYLIMTLYVFAAIGAYSFSMLDQVDQTLIVEGSPYDSAPLHWEAVNFGDLRSAYFTLVQLLVQSNWAVTHDACVQAVTGHYERQDGACGGACGFATWLTTLYHASFQFCIATVLAYSATSFVLEQYADVHDSVSPRRNAARVAAQVAPPTAMDSSSGQGDSQAAALTSLKALRSLSLGEQSCRCNPLDKLRLLKAWCARNLWLYWYGQCANCSRASETLPVPLVCKRVFMPTFVPDWRRALGSQQQRQAWERDWQGFQPVMLCQECEALHLIKHFERCRVAKPKQDAKQGQQDEEGTGYEATDGRRRSLSPRQQRKAARRAAAQAEREEAERLKRDCKRQLLGQIEARGGDGVHAQSGHAEGVFFKLEPGSTAPVPLSFGGGIVRARSPGDRSAVGGGVGLETTAIFGVDVEQLQWIDVELGGGGDGDEPKLQAPAFLVEVLKRLEDLGALMGSGVAAILGEAGPMDPAALAEATTMALQLAEMYNADEVDLLQRSDDPAVWAALLRQWHDEMPSGGRLLSWPRGTRGAHSRALELGATHSRGAGELKKNHAEAEALLQQLQPRQRGAIVLQIHFWARLDRKQAELGPRGALEHTLARWWLDPPRAASSAQRRQQEDAGAGFIALLLNLDPAHDPVMKHALGALKEERDTRRREASLAILQGDGAKKDEDEEPTEAADAPTKKKKKKEEVISEYGCVKRCDITAGIELGSVKVGSLRVGEKVGALEEAQVKVEGALPGPSYLPTGEVQESTSPTSSDAPEGEVHRVRCRRGWVSVHTRHGAPVLKPKVIGKAASFGEEGYSRGMASGRRPDSLGASSMGMRSGGRGVRNGGGGGDSASGHVQDGASLGREWARTKKGRETQQSNLWSGGATENEP